MNEEIEKLNKQDIDDGKTIETHPDCTIMTNESLRNNLSSQTDRPVGETQFDKNDKIDKRENGQTPNPSGEAMKNGYEMSV